MSGLIAIPVMAFLMILQTTVVKEVNLLHGSADILLVWLSAWVLRDESQAKWIWLFAGIGLGIFVSAIPRFAIVGGYAAIYLFVKMIHKRLWQSPLISTFLVVMVSSIILYLTSYLGLQLETGAYPFQETLIQVIIPSIFLNLFFSLPVYLLARDVYRWVTPFREE
jgi:hypothetical protein